MKKILKTALIVLVLAAAVLAYNYVTDYSLFDLQDIGVQTYLDEEQELQGQSNSTGYEKLYYPQLDSEGRKIYDKIYFAIKEHKETVRIHGSADSKTVFDIFGYVLSENPEFFWTNGSCSYSNDGTLTLSYIYSEQECAEVQAQIDAVTAPIVEKACAASDEYETALLLYDYIVLNTKYNSAAADNPGDYPEASTIAGVFIDKKAICGGYARAYQYLLSKCSLNAETVIGVAEASQGDTADHAWTLQYLDGSYYYTDVTWGDALETNGGDYVSHMYFCMSYDEVSSTHTLNDSVIYPECTSKRDNYFVRENLLFESYNVSKIRKAVKEIVSDGGSVAEIKFVNYTDYKTATDGLIENGGIYYVLLEVDPFSTKIVTDSLMYNLNDDKKVITLMLERK